MEHTEREHTLAVARRYLLRRWRVPAKVGGAVLASLGLVTFGADRLRTQKVEASSQLAPLTAEGVVESLRVRGIGAAFDGPVIELAVRQGQQVKKGDLLLRMDTRHLENELARAKADASTTWQTLRDARSRRSAEIAEAQSQVRLLQREVAREREQMATAHQRVANESPVLVTEEGDTFTIPEPETPVVDVSRIKELESRLAVAREQLKYVAATWEPVIQDAKTAHQAAARQVRELNVMIAAAERRSPMDGVVTEVATRPGDWAAKGEALVRVDDPTGFRVVTLVDQDIRSRVEKTPVLTVDTAGVKSTAKLEKVVDGEERELFYYYLWLKPENPRRLHPGQRIPVTVPAGGQLTASL